MSETKLSREIGLFGAVMLGLGSIIGTGAFVAIGIAAGIAGSFLIVSILVASLIALCNALSSAQLAADHPVSGGTYEYGRKYLNNLVGFIAGWLFICAKSASAATAAIGLSGYFFSLININSSSYLMFGALGSVLLLTLLVCSGIKRTNLINSIIVLITLFSLTLFIVLGASIVSEHSVYSFKFLERIDEGSFSMSSIFYGSALMFVAFTGYGRIATLGEEVRNPSRIIPIAILITLLVSTFLYILIGFIGLKVLGPDLFTISSENNFAPLKLVMEKIDSKWPIIIVSVGAITAMLGVLLNLVLGISRVILAMGRNNDLPIIFSTLRNSSPTYAVLLSGLIITVLVIIGDIKSTWSLSAFMVLLYYSITNLAALKIPKNKRLFPKWLAVLGLIGCLLISFYVDSKSFFIGTILIISGVVWFFINNKIKTHH